MPVALPISSSSRRRRSGLLKRKVYWLDDDELLAGAHDIGADFALLVEAEEVPRFIDRLGAAGEDERAIVAELVGIGDQLIRFGRVNLHAGDEQHLRQPAFEAGLARAKLRVPLRLDDARVAEAGADQGAGDGPRAGPKQAHVGEKKRAPPRPPVERGSNQAWDIRVI